MNAPRARAPGPSISGGSGFFMPGPVARSAPARPGLVGLVWSPGLVWSVARPRSPGLVWSGFCRPGAPDTIGPACLPALASATPRSSARSAAADPSRSGKIFFRVASGATPQDFRPRNRDNAAGRLCSRANHAASRTYTTAPMRSQTGAGP